MNLQLFFTIFFIGTLVFFSIRSKTKRLIKACIPLCITTTGFSGMIFDLVLIFTFQALYGYVFHWIGLLVTTFMVGVAGGSLYMTSILGRIKKDFSLFLKLEVAIIIFSFILPLVFFSIHPFLDREVVFLFLQTLFLILSLFSGFLIGAQFPLANKIYLGNPSNLTKTAGLLYSSDLFGGWIGGVIGGVVLLPVLGLLGTCIVVVMLKVTSLVILATSVRRWV